jgi:hypothetical protein
VSDKERNPIYPPGHTPKWWKKNPELWATALRDMPSSDMHAPNNTESQMWSRIRELLGPVFIVGGFGVISKDFFWPGVFIVYLGCVILYLETVFEPWVLKLSFLAQFLLIVMSLAIPAWFTLAIVDAERPLKIDSYANRKGNYSNGSKIGTVEWDSHFLPLTVAISNPSSLDYSDVNIAIMPDSWVYKASLIGDDFGCRVDSIGGKSLMTTITKSSGKRTFTAHRIGDTFQGEDDAGDIFTSLATDGGYRLRCSQLPKKSSVRVVFAAVGFSPSTLKNIIAPPDPKLGAGSWRMQASEWIGGKSLFEMFDQRPNPVMVKLDGSYRVKMRENSVSREVDVRDGN